MQLAGTLLFRPPRLLTSSLLDMARLANGLWTTANGLNAPQLPRERKKKQTV